jgi:hypothetical protein
MTQAQITEYADWYWDGLIRWGEWPAAYYDTIAAAVQARKP